MTKEKDIPYTEMFDLLDELFDTVFKHERKWKDHGFKKDDISLLQSVVVFQVLKDSMGHNIPDSVKDHVNQGRQEIGKYWEEKYSG